MNTKRTATCIALVLSMIIAAHAKEWRGIVPLHSTRSDVGELLSPPNDDDLDSFLVSYHLPDVIVDIQHAANPECAEVWPYGSWNVPKRTVTLIRVAPRKDIHLSDLKLDLTRFKKERVTSDVLNHFYYIDEDEGFSISVQELNGRSDAWIEAFLYGPRAKETSLRCKPGRWRFAAPTISFRSAQR